MGWDTTGLKFLYQPDVFTGTFSSEKMEQRHQLELARKLSALKEQLAATDCPLTALQYLNKNDQLTFLHNNLEKFQEAGKFEETVLYLYGKLNAPFSSGGNSAEWNRLFRLCDRARLADLGTAPPFSRTTLYRGSVSGFSRSLSWTPDVTRASQFAERWRDPDLGGGQIYMIEASAEQVLVFRQLKREHEVLLDPDFVETVEIIPFTP